EQGKGRNDRFVPLSPTVFGLLGPIPPAGPGSLLLPERTCGERVSAPGSGSRRPPGRLLPLCPVRPVSPREGRLSSDPEDAGKHGPHGSRNRWTPAGRAPWLSPPSFAFGGPRCARCPIERTPFSDQASQALRRNQSGGQGRTNHVHTG